MTNPDETRKVTVSPYRPTDAYYAANRVELEDNEEVAAYLKGLARLLRKTPGLHLDTIQIGGSQGQNMIYSYFTKDE